MPADAQAGKTNFRRAAEKNHKKRAAGEAALFKRGKEMKSVSKTIFLGCGFIITALGPQMVKKMWRNPEIFMNIWLAPKEWI